MNSLINNQKICLKEFIPSKVIFTARVYKVNKKNGYHSYFATIRQNELNYLKLRENSAILLKINEQIFPTLIRKLHTTKNRFMYGFSIPQNIGKDLEIKSDINFEFLSTNLTQKIKINSKDNLYLPNILPQKTIRNKNLYLFGLNDKILIWIYSTGNAPYILPKYIPLIKNGYDLLELFGGYFCEGFKSRKINTHMDRLSYSSSEIDQIEWFINSMENLFGIQKSGWSAQILSSNKTDGIQGSLKEYWRSIGLQKEKINVIKNELVNDKHGVCLISIYSSTLAETMYELFQYCKQLALNNKENSLRFFRGLSRGDMGVSSIRNKQNILNFSTDTKNNIIFFNKICSNLNIKTGKIIEDKRGKNGCWQVAIHDFNSFQNIIRLNAIAHQRRKNNFYYKFLECRGCTPFKYLKAVSEGHNTNQKVAEHLQLSIFTTMALLSKYKKIGLFNAKIKSTGKIHRIYYSLSKKGQKLLDFYNNVEKEIKDNNI